jgi:hypothetical protein
MVQCLGRFLACQTSKILERGLFELVSYSWISRSTERIETVEWDIIHPLNGDIENASSDSNHCLDGLDISIRNIEG